MLTVDTRPATGEPGPLIPVDGVAEVMTLRVLGARLSAWAIPAPNFVWFVIDDHRPDVLVEVVWHVRPSGARYSVHSIHRITKD